MSAFVPVVAGLIRGTNHRRENPLRISKQRDGGVGTTVALNRFLFKEEEVDVNGVVHLPNDDYRSSHVREVLRVEQGALVRAGIVDQCLIDDVPLRVNEDKSVAFKLAFGRRSQMPPSPPISLILAVPRPKVLARLLSQVAALGVRDIVLCNAYKVEKSYFNSALLKKTEEREGLLIDGVSQSGVDCRLPHVTVEPRLRIFLEDRLPLLCSQNTHLLIAEPGSGTSVFETIYNSKLDSEECREPHIVLAIGPEGGWMPREVSMFEDMFGFKRVSLGNRILRTDAAVLILLGLIGEFIRVKCETQS